MKVARQIPEHVLTAIVALLAPYVHDATPTAIVDALKNHAAVPPPADAARPRLLSLKDAGRALGVSGWTVRRRVIEGAIRATRVGAQWRVPVAEIDRLATVETTDPEN